MRRFLRKPARAREPLPVTMTGARMGERLLQIGLHDPALAALLAAKPGLSGNAVIVVASEEAAARARRACEDRGVLGDVQVSPLAALAQGDAQFDAVVVHTADPAVASLDDAAMVQLLRECLRALRNGGRLIAIDTLPKSGLAGLFSSRKPDLTPRADPLRALEAAGFRAVRLLGEREGFRFNEGLKG